MDESNEIESSDELPTRHRFAAVVLAAMAALAARIVVEKAYIAGYNRLNEETEDEDNS